MHLIGKCTLNSEVCLVTWFYVQLPCRYAKIHIPIIASVSEHQPTTWTSFFFDLHILVCIFPAGIWFVMKHLTDERVFCELDLSWTLGLLSLSPTHTLSLSPPMHLPLFAVHRNLCIDKRTLYSSWHKCVCAWKLFSSLTSTQGIYTISVSCFYCSGFVCYICCVLCWCDGSSDADANPNSVCTGSHCYIPLSRQLSTAKPIHWR